MAADYRTVEPLRAVPSLSLPFDSSTCQCCSSSAMYFLLFQSCSRQARGKLHISSSKVIIRGSDTSTLIMRSAVASHRLEQMCFFGYPHRRTFESCKDRLGSSCCSKRANYTVSYRCCASHRLTFTPRSCIYGARPVFIISKPVSAGSVQEP